MRGFDEGGHSDIGDEAFLDCTGVMTLVLHEGLARIGKGVFGRCEGLRNVDIPSTVRSDIGAFHECKGSEFLSLLFLLLMIWCDS
eukprot:scaffold1749_cov54-Cylindrotheca_fusiformis.AAC.1